jgi:hypothetical protein
MKDTDTMDKKFFLQSIAKPLNKAGLQRRKKSWYMDGEEVLAFVNFEFHTLILDQQYVINIGFWLKALGSSNYPSYNHCHLYYRVERLFPEYREFLLKSSSLLETDVELVNELAKFIDDTLIPFLRECTQEQKLRDMMAKGLLEGGLVRKEARWYLTEGASEVDGNSFDIHD